MLRSKVLENQQLSAVSRLFSAGVLSDLAKNGRSPAFARLTMQTPIVGSLESRGSVSDVFDAAFDFLRMKEHRNEYVYKSAITRKILLGRHSLNTAVMLSEFRANQSKADTVIFNGTSTAYEIKSERDTLSRLKQQILDYRDVFACVNVISGENHIANILNTVPEDVGVLLLTDRYQIKTVRNALELPERTKPESIYSAIRINEAKEILAKNGYAIPDVPNTQIYTELKRLFSLLRPEVAHQGMVSELKKKRDLSPLENFLRKLPESIHSLVLTMRLNSQDQERLIGAVNTPISSALKWQ